MLRAVEDVLEEIGAGDRPRLLVLNKADAVEDREAVRFRHPEGVMVSAITGEGIPELTERIVAEFERTLVDVELLVPFQQGGILHELHELAGDLEREDTAEGVRVAIRLPRPVAARFDRYSLNGHHA